MEYAAIPSFLILPIGLFFVGFGAGFLPKGWLAIPAISLVPISTLGAFDDGESIYLITAWTLAWPAFTAMGYGVGRWARRRPVHGPQVT